MLVWRPPRRHGRPRRPPAGLPGGRVGEVEALGVWVGVTPVSPGGCGGAAGLLMLPYLVWVSFAAWLNYKVVQLNGPFG